MGMKAFVLSFSIEAMLKNNFWTNWESVINIRKMYRM